MMISERTRVTLGLYHVALNNHNINPALLSFLGRFYYGQLSRHDIRSRAIATCATALVRKSDNVVINHRVLDETMILLNYCEKALQQAQYKKLDDGTWFADIEGFEGVWGNGLTVEECRQDLLEVLEEWMHFSRSMN